MIFKMKIGFIILFFIFLENILEASANNKKGNVSHKVNKTVAGEARTQSVPDGTTLQNALRTLGVTYPEELALIDLTKLKVKDHSGSTFKIVSEESDKISVGNLLFFASEVTFDGKIEVNTLVITNPQFFQIRFKGETYFRWDTSDSFELKLGNDIQEAKVKLKNRQTSIDINTLLQGLGYSDKESYINTQGLTAALRKDTSWRNKDDKFDEANLIHVRIGSDNNWHLSFAYDYENFYPGRSYIYQMFVCTHLGIPEVEEKGCAYIREIDNKAKFLDWAKTYAPDLDFNLLSLPMGATSSVQTSKTDLDYSNREDEKFMQWMTIKKNGVSMPSELIGGTDFFVIKMRLSRKYNDFRFQDPQFEQFSDLFFVGKLYADRLELELQPKISITTMMLSYVFKSTLSSFFRYKMPLANIFIEKIILTSSGVCVSFSFAQSYQIIGEKYKIEKSVLRVCSLGKGHEVNSVSNEEVCFNAKAYMNTEYDKNIDTGSLTLGAMKISGGLMIVEARQFFEETASFLPETHQESMQHLSNFPISNLQHYFTVGAQYMRFEGQAILFDTRFTMQVVYRTEGVTSPIGLCLELDVDTEAGDKKKRQNTGDTEESTESELEIINPPKPISLSNFTKYLLKKKDLGFNAVTKFGFLRVSFQDDIDLYKTLKLEDDQTFKCARIVKKLKEKNIELVPNNPGVFISASKADYGCTEGATEEKKLCNYLKSALGLQRQRFSTQKFYGYIKPTMMKMMAWYPEDKTLQIHDRFIMREFTQTIGFDESDSGFQGNQFYGKGDISFSGSFRLNSYLLISENSLYFNCPQQTPSPPIDIVEALLVKTKRTLSQRHLLETGENLKLVFQGDVLIGPGQLIEIGGESDIVEQYLYSDATKDKLLACKNKDAVSVNLKDIARSFNIFLTQDVFDVTLTDVCFTYNGENAIWNVTSVSILAEEGLWLHGKKTIQARSKFGTIEDFVINVRMKCTGHNQRIIFGRPPLYFYSITTPVISGLRDTVESNEELDFKVVISKSKEAKDVGPDLIINIGPNTRLAPELHGYITTVAFEGPVTFDVETSDYTTFKFLRDPVEEAKKRTANTKPPLLTEGFEVKGSLAPNADAIQFRFTGQGLVDRIKQNYSLLVDGKKSFYEEKKLEHTALQVKITEDSTAPTSKASKKNELENMYKEIQSIKGNFRKEERKKFEPCSNCKAVKAPGFIWDSCDVSDRVGKVSCLQFKKDALKACDTECLAKCDLNKVEAEENAEAIQQDLHRRSEILEKRSQETEIYDTLEIDLDRQKNLRAPKISTFQEELDSFNGISNICPIKNIKTDWVDFSDFKRADTLDFTLVFPGSSSNEEDIEIVKPYVVDGYLPSRVAEYYFNDKHGTDASDVDEKEKAVQTSFGESLSILRDWEIENRETLKKLRWRGQQTISKKVKRAFDDLRAYESPTSFFHDEPVSTNVALKKFAPWNILRRSNPFIYTNKTVNTAKRMKVSKSASFCTNRRNRIRDYKDMVKYMKSWSDSFDQANMFLRDSKTLISNGINNLATHMLQKRSLNNGTFSQKKQRVSEKWVNRLKAGFTNWENEFQHQLVSYYTTSPKIMFREMNEIFTPAEFKSLQSYLQSTPSNALSRSITPDPPLQLIGQTLLNGFASMKTLDDNKNFVNQLTSMISQAEQSSQHCHDEL